MTTMNTATGKAPPRAAYPGLSQAMSAAADLVMKGQQPNPNQFFTRRHKFYHRIDYGTGGTASVQLFNNVTPQRWICNLPIQAQLSNEMFFKLEAVRIWAETGITAAATYTRASGGAQSSAAALTQLTNAEEIRTIIQGGALTLSIGDKRVVDQMYGITSFPSGGGASVNPAVTTTASTTSASAAVLNNGDPNVANVFSLKPAYPVLPGKTIAALLEWQAALSVTTAFVMRVELDGVLCTPANN